MGTDPGTERDEAVGHARDEAVAASCVLTREFRGSRVIIDPVAWQAPRVVVGARELGVAPPARVDAVPGEIRVRPEVFSGRVEMPPRAPAPAFSINRDRFDRSIVHMPSPRAALRHAIPTVFEGLVAPIALFYSALVLGGLRWALVASLSWSYAALIRRLLRGERASMVLILGTLLLTVRTAVSFATGSAFIYFAQPLIGTVLIALILVVSAVVRRPFTHRFAHDFCPIDPELLLLSRVQRFFIRISLMWAAVLMVNSGLVAWLLITSSLQTFVLERTAITWSLTAAAIFFSIFGFSSTMRRGGYSLRWGSAPHVPT